MHPQEEITAIQTSSFSWKRITPLVAGALIIFALGGGVGWYVGNTKPSEEVPAPGPTASEASPTPVPTVTIEAEASLPDKNTPIPTQAPAQTISLVSTEGWKSVAVGGVSLKVPADARVEIKGNEALIYTTNQYIPDRVTVEPYQGGSRRDQFLSKSSYEDCHWVIQEGRFGTVAALQIAADGGWCQGGAGGIVTVVGNNYVVFHNLFYDLNTKEIHRSSLRDTMVSTVSAG